MRGRLVLVSLCWAAAALGRQRKWPCRGGAAAPEEAPQEDETEVIPRNDDLGVVARDDPPDEVFVSFQLDPIAFVYSASLRIRSVLRFAWNRIVSRLSSAGGDQQVVRKDKAAAKERNRFAAAYPPCRSGSVVSAAATARQRGVPLVILAATGKADVHRLGAALEDEEAALRTALDDYVLWGATTPAALKAATRLCKLADIPSHDGRTFVALAIPGADGEFAVVASHAARQTQPRPLADSLARWLARSSEAHAAPLAALKRTAADAALVAEQSMELREATASDHEAVAAAAKQAADDAAAVAKAEASAARRLALAAALAPEPAADRPACTVALRLPDGSKASRRFEPSAPCAAVFDWAEGTLGVDLADYAIRRAAAARKPLPNSDARTLQSELGSRALLECAKHDAAPE